MTEQDNTVPAPYSVAEAKTIASDSPAPKRRSTPRKAASAATAAPDTADAPAKPTRSRQRTAKSPAPTAAKAAAAEKASAKSSDKPAEKNPAARRPRAKSPETQSAAGQSNTATTAPTAATDKGTAQTSAQTTLARKPAESAAPEARSTKSSPKSETTPTPSRGRSGRGQRSAAPKAAPGTSMPMAVAESPALASPASAPVRTPSTSEGNTAEAGTARNTRGRGQNSRGSRRDPRPQQGQGAEPKPASVPDNMADSMPGSAAAPRTNPISAAGEKRADAQSPRPKAAGVNTDLDQKNENSAADNASVGPGTERGAERDAEMGAELGPDGEPRRKSRRGRRGGRGRNRKNRQNGETPTTDLASDAQNGDEVQSATAPRSADQTSQSEALGAQAEGPTAEAEASPEISGAPSSPAPAAVPASPSRGRGRAAASGAKNAPAAGNPKAAKGLKPEAEDDEPARSPRGAAAKAKTEAVAAGRQRMFISVLPGEQVEVALSADGQVLEYYLDMLHQRKIKGNIYRGVIHNIDTNLQAAFVSYGAGKNGFLQIDEIHPEYWLTPHEAAKGKKFPPIQKVLKAGQEVLVQVVKEPTGNKGAFLTTWLSLAGRFLVLTPGQEQIGVSRKVDNEEERARLREMMNGIEPGPGLGVIVRTVSAGTTKTTLKNDLQYLKRVWRDIRKKATEVTAPNLIYQEPGLSERAVRDYLTEDVCEIWVDSEDVAQSIRETVSLLFPRKQDLVRLHNDPRQPMWERFSLRRQLDQIYSREVLLPSGGRLVFDQTEALMAIDINSGKISGKGNFEAMAHKTNMEAAEAIARHLRLRDIGGQVVIDFIEMRDKKHVMEVEKTLRQAMKNDRARHDVARMSSFGLLELVRQRTGSSALAISMEPCPVCAGTGQRRNLEWQSLQALRELRRNLRSANTEKYVFETNADLGLYLLNHKRDSLRDLEQEFGKGLEISVRP